MISKNIEDLHPRPGPAVPQWVPATTIAAVVQCHPRTVARWARQHFIPGPVVIGGAYRYDLEAVITAIHAKSDVPTDGVGQ